MVKKLTALMFFISFNTWAQVPSAMPAVMTAAPSFSTPVSGMNPNSSSAAQPQKVRLTFKMATYLDKMKENQGKDKGKEKKKPEKEIIVKKFDYDTYYHHSKTDKLVKSVLDSTVEFSNLRRNDISFLNMVITSMDIKEFPSQLEKKVKATFSKEHLRYIKEKLRHPFYQKLTKELLNVEKVYRNNMLDARKLKITNDMNERFWAIKEIVENTKSDIIVRDIKRILRAYFMAYSNLRNGKEEVILARRKARIRSPKKMPKLQMKRAIDNMYFSKGFLSFYHKAFFLALRRLSRAEILEGRRLSRDPILKEFFEIRHRVLTKILSKTRKNVKKTLLASVNVQSIKSKKDNKQKDKDNVKVQ